MPPFSILWNVIGNHINLSSRLKIRSGERARMQYASRCPSSLERVFPPNKMFDELSKMEISRYRLV